MRLIQKLIVNGLILNLLDIYNTSVNGIFPACDLPIQSVTNRIMAIGMAWFLYD
jgi:hypothetical protein